MEFWELGHISPSSEIEGLLVQTMRYLRAKVYFKLFWNQLSPENTASFPLAAPGSPSDVSRNAHDIL